MKKAVVLLSGGLDSATTLYIAQRRGFQCHCLIVDYGQRHRREIESAKKVAAKAGCVWSLVRIPMPWGRSALTDRRIPVPKRRSLQKMSRGIPSTYVPARNTIFLSLAASLAESVGATHLFIGANAIDYSGYPDCRPGFFKAYQEAIKQGTRAGAQGRGIQIVAPLLRFSKAQIICLGKRLGVPYQLTWSCYLGKGRPCGVCDSCLLRRKGFQEVGFPDPAKI